MLTEQFIASISAPSKTPNASLAKDAGIFVHEYQPLAGPKHVFKKSGTAQHCLAANDTHVFAAQAEKAVIHVYNREKGNQEALMPFQEKICAVKLVCDGTVLAIGTESGRLLLWETATGRLVAAASSHLQEINCIEADEGSNFLLTGSADSVVNVWSTLHVLSFSSSADTRSPVRALSSHRSPITALAVGHSSSFANIAVSASKDDTAMVWNYHTGDLLRTYLLGSSPLALCLDPADRGFYAGYNDGSVQLVDFFLAEEQGQVAVDKLRSHQDSTASAVVELPTSTRWSSEASKLGATLSLSLSWDLSTLLSGHDSGKIATWNIAQGSFTSELTTLPGPVTNLRMLNPSGFPGATSTQMSTSIVKPRPDLTEKDSDGIIPGHYALSAHLWGGSRHDERGSTEQSAGIPSSLAHPSFSPFLIEAGLAELADHTSVANGPTKTQSAFSQVKARNDESSADFMSMDADADQPAFPLLTEPERIADLEERIVALQKVQKVTFQQLSSLRKEKAEGWRRQTGIPQVADQANSTARTNGIAKSAHNVVKNKQANASSLRSGGKDQAVSSDDDDDDDDDAEEDIESSAEGDDREDDEDEEDEIEMDVDRDLATG